jgi:hypothetical protein
MLNLKKRFGKSFRFFFLIGRNKMKSGELGMFLTSLVSFDTSLRLYASHGVFDDLKRKVLI